MIEYKRNPEIPSLPSMFDITDLFANLANNWFHMRYVMYLLLGILFGFFLLKKVMKVVKGESDDD